MNISIILPRVVEGIVEIVCQAALLRGAVSGEPRAADLQRARAAGGGGHAGGVRPAPPRRRALPRAPQQEQHTGNTYPQGSTPLVCLLANCSPTLRISVELYYGRAMRQWTGIPVHMLHQIKTLFHCFFLKYHLLY